MSIEEAGQAVKPGGQLPPSENNPQGANGVMSLRQSQPPGCPHLFPPTVTGSVGLAAGGAGAGAGAGQAVKPEGQLPTLSENNWQGTNGETSLWQSQPPACPHLFPPTARSVGPAVGGAGAGAGAGQAVNPEGQLPTSSEKGWQGANGETSFLQSQPACTQPSRAAWASACRTVATNSRPTATGSAATARRSAKKNATPTT